MNIHIICSYMFFLDIFSNILHKSQSTLEAALVSFKLISFSLFSSKIHWHQTFFPPCSTTGPYLYKDALDDNNTTTVYFLQPSHLSKKNGNSQ